MRYLPYLFVLSLLATACGGGEVDGTDSQHPSSGSGGIGGANTGGVGGDTSSGGTDSGGHAGDGGSNTGGTSAGNGGNELGGQGGNTTLSVERWGARLRGADMAIRRSGRLLWIGSRALPDPYDGTLRGGLTRLDLDTGDVRIFETELPKGTYDDGEGPMATAEAFEDGSRTLIVAREGVLVRDGDSFSLHEIGSNATPYTIVLDRSGGRNRLWVGTNAGLFRLNADTLAQEKLVEISSLGGEPTKLAVDPKSGDVYAVITHQQGTTAAQITDEKITTVSPGKDGVDAGLLGEVVFSNKLNAALFSLRTWDASTGGILRWSGTKVERMLTEGQLAKAATGTASAFGAATLALDDDSGLLLVGGQIQSKGMLGLLGGGLAWVQLDTWKVAGLSMGRDGLPGDHVASLAYDPVNKRAYATLRQPCNELKLGNKSLVAISFRDEKTPRYERPILSGVRTFTKVGDRTLIGLRDDSPGLSCDGYPIQTGLYELHSNRSAELVALHTEGDSLISPDAGLTAMAASGERLAIGTFRDGGWIGIDGLGFAFNPTEFGPSLYMQDVVWQGDSLWIAGRATHMPSDPPSLADVGPRGAARLTLSGNKVISSEHFVSTTKNPGPTVGLPSSEITTVLPGKDGSTFLICATERASQSVLDRDSREIFLVDGQPREGGIALVKGKEVTVLTQPGEIPDPRAATLDAEGTLLLLDAKKGAFRFLNGKLSPLELPAQPPKGSVPISLWYGAQGLVATYDRGAVVSLAGQSKVIEGVGYVWRAFERGVGVLLLGSDEGILRVSTSVDPMEKAPGVAVLPAFQTP